jgi:hypothetical protein
MSPGFCCAHKCPQMGHDPGQFESCGKVSTLHEDYRRWHGRLNTTKLYNTSVMHVRISTHSLPACKANNCAIQSCGNGKRKCALQTMTHYCRVSQVVAGLDLKQRAALLKFVTSVSRAPLGGFQHLQPPLTIHRVRLPLPLSIGPQIQVGASLSGVGGQCRLT